MSATAAGNSAAASARTGKGIFPIGGEVEAGVDVEGKPNNKIPGFLPHSELSESPAFNYHTARAVTILLVRCCATAVDGECEQDILIRFQTHWSDIFPSNFKPVASDKSVIDTVNDCVAELSNDIDEYHNEKIDLVAKKMNS
ncbi:hypothetical protein KIW84_054809 [Lathyrus oleraceus]|uniref:Uncharacterized protein n=1 Tax=Pisum sativum TaxID=3888 RepID=A0A9D4WWN4_PEA|nr:hypothetical protein KIW84_054809 [Pisum sativum]